MREFKILTYPNPILKKKAARVTRVTDREKEILSGMAKAMYLSRGVGLAANQVGIALQLIVLDAGDGLSKFINPVIVKKEGSDTQEEGCLSVPETCVRVRRAKKITVNYMDETGRAGQIKAEGLMGRALQHEIDHLCGKLIIDRLNPIKKILAGKRIRQASGKLDKTAGI